MPRLSAGILLWRRTESGPEVFLVHPGGPFWARKDDGAWSIPKGEIAPGEDGLAAARREFLEETGFALVGSTVALPSVRQKGGKVVHAWAVEGNIDPAALRSNQVELIWPPRSGRTQRFPEVDRAAWYDLATARRKLLQGQVALLDALEALLAGGHD